MPTFERLIPLLTYHDIPAAHDFLVCAFAFTPGGIHRTPDGLAVHRRHPRPHDDGFEYPDHSSPHAHSRCDARAPSSSS